MSPVLALSGLVTMSDLSPLFGGKADIA
jgi:hypothetical protein